MKAEFPDPKMELTPWFAKKVKPVHKGCYEIRLPCNCCSVVRYWNGAKWFFLDKLTPARDQDVQWRGLAEKP